MHFALAYNRPMRLLSTALGTGPRRSGATIDDDQITIAMGWAFRATFRRDDVERSERLDHLAWWWGQGVHGWRGTVVVNGAHHGLVRMHLAPGVRAQGLLRFRLRTLVVSLEDPDGFLALLGR